MKSYNVVLFIERVEYEDSSKQMVVDFGEETKPTVVEFTSKKEAQQLLSKLKKAL